MMRLVSHAAIRAMCVAAVVLGTTAAFGKTKYWIGTTPEATLGSNWADESGGKPTEMPVDGDDIVLNGNSKDMKWGGRCRLQTPELDADGGLRRHGHLRQRA